MTNRQRRHVSRSVFSTVASALSSFVLPLPAHAGIDETIDAAVRPLTDAVSAFIFYTVPVFGADLPLIVVWLIVGATFFTVYLGFINIRGFRHAIDIVRGRYSDPDHPGEVSHFAALATAVSGTVGIGNIGGVAVAVSVGGPGATFWLIVAGLLGMSTKFVECTLAVKYRRENPDGSVSGGPMYFLEKGIGEHGWPGLGRALAIFYAASIVVGCLGIGNMFQSNQAFAQLVNVTGSETSFFADKGWLVGLILAICVSLVIIGGIKSIARVTSKLVPFMLALYVVGGVAVLVMNAGEIPGAVNMIIVGAFQPDGVAGGALGVMILGFRRAVFSNEAGLGSAAIAHSAVKTSEPLTEGYVSLLEPFLDTVVICTVTALVIITTVYDPSLAGSGMSGIEMTSRAFESTISWSPYPLALAAILFAFSTMIAWSYYGLKAWTYLAGENRLTDTIFKMIFCGFVILGCSIQLDAVIDLSDALVFVVALPNILGLYLLAPIVKRELSSYEARMASGQIRPTR